MAQVSIYEATTSKKKIPTKRLVARVAGQCSDTSYKHDYLHCKNCHVQPHPCLLQGCPCNGNGVLFFTGHNKIGIHQMKNSSYSVRIKLNCLRFALEDIEKSIHRQKRLDAVLLSRKTIKDATSVRKIPLPHYKLIGGCSRSAHDPFHRFLDCRLCLVYKRKCQIPNCACKGKGFMAYTTNRETILHQECPGKKAQLINVSALKV